MPHVNITKELGQSLKELRIANKIKSKDISEAIKKSPTYLSKLENGEIQKIDINDLMTIFHSIFLDNNTFEIKFEEFIGKCTIKYSEEERKKQIWIINFDTVYRQIPIPPLLIDYCNEQIKLAKISISELVARINLNEDLKDDNLDLSKYNRNEWYWENADVGYFAIMDVSFQDIDLILSGKKTVSNYITIQALVYNILRFISPNQNEALSNTIHILNNYKFYSINERNKKLKESHSIEEINDILTDFDKINLRITDNIKKHFKQISNINIKYANEKLNALSENFNTDPSLTIAYLGINLTSLKDINNDTKRDFLNDIKELVKKYEALAPKEEKITLL